MPTPSLPSFTKAAGVLHRLRTSKLEPAIMDSLNRQAYSGRKAEKANLPRALDRPRTFTLNSIRARKAERVSGGLESAVTVAPKMQAILRRLEYGGQESAGLNIADQTFANQYGDLGKAGVLRILRRDRKSRRISSATKAKKAAAAAKAPKGAAAKAKAKAKKAGKPIYRGKVFSSKDGRKVENPNERFFVAKIKKTTALWRRLPGKRKGAQGRLGKARNKLVPIVVFRDEGVKYEAQLGFRVTARTNARRYNELVLEAYERAVAKASAGS